MEKRINQNKMEKRKPINPIEPEEEENDLNFLQIGDITIQSKRSTLPKCKAFAEQILRSKTIKSYLCNFEKKRLFSKPDYID